jgi:type III secretion protein U
MSSSSEEKTEPATEHKLRKSREEGQVAKSRDATAAGALLGAVTALMVGSESMLQRMQSVFRTALAFSGSDLTMQDLRRSLAAMAFDALWLVLPIVLAAAVLAAGFGFAQAGFQITMKAVAPKFERVDPAEGCKRIFSARSVVTFAMMLAKAVLIAAAMWALFVHLLPLGVGSAYLEPKSIGVVSWGVLGKLLGLALLIALVIGPFDYAIERWLFLRDQRMGKSEVKRDHKESDGDPLIKSQRLQIAREMARESPRDAVARANAVIVNPTHFAVALRYVREENGLPVVIAKGVDEQALDIRRAAEDSGVPVFTNPPLARALHQVPLHQAVPTELFEPVAAVLRWVGGLGRAPA